MYTSTVLDPAPYPDGTHWVLVWVGSCANPDVLEQNESLALAGNRLHVNR
jgi:hypothetical protein